jgi:hypothetical protein
MAGKVDKEKLKSDQPAFVPISGTTGGSRKGDYKLPVERWGECAE